MSPADRLFDAASRILAPARWRNYYARWERRERRRIGGTFWTAIARIEVNDAGTGHARGLAYFSLVRASPTRRERTSLTRSPEFKRMLNDLEDAGFREVGTLEPSDQLLKQFPATPRALRQEHMRVDKHLGGVERGRPVKAQSARRIAAARREFASARGWRSAGAGWSIRAELADGSSATFAILLVQREDGTLVGRRELRAIACVLVWPPENWRTADIERYAPTIRAAGYKGGLQRMPRRGQRKTSVFGDFWKDRPGHGGIAAERRRLEALKAALQAASKRSVDA